MSAAVLILLWFAALYAIFVLEVGQFVSFGRGCERPYDWSEES